DVPLYIASTNPLTWLAWAEGRLDVEEVTPCLSRSVCDTLGLPAEERCYFMRHCREALARLWWRRAADKSIPAPLGAIPHHERLSRPRAVRTAQDCQERTVTGDGCPWLALSCATGTQGQHTRAQYPWYLLDFASALKTEQLHACLRYEPLTLLEPD